MSKYLIYGVGFFIATLLIQSIVHGINKDKNKKWQIYTGPTVILGLCVIGLIQQEIAFLAAIMGFVVADGIGEALGWY